MQNIIDALGTFVNSFILKAEHQAHGNGDLAYMILYSAARTLSRRDE